MQGRSLLPLLKPESRTSAATGSQGRAPHREFVRCEHLNALWQDPAGETPTTHGTMYRDQRWKLVVYHSHGLGELYDLDSDPHEFHSLWDDPEYDSVKTELLQASFNATVMAADPGPAVPPAALG
jgi:hypothetical protein